MNIYSIILESDDKFDFFSVCNKDMVLDTIQMFSNDFVQETNFEYSLYSVEEIPLNKKLLLDNDPNDGKTWVIFRENGDIVIENTYKPMLIHNEEYQSYKVGEYFKID